MRKKRFSAESVPLGYVAGLTAAADAVSLVDEVVPVTGRSPPLRIGRSQPRLPRRVDSTGLAASAADEFRREISKPEVGSSSLNHLRPRRTIRHFRFACTSMSAGATIIGAATRPYFRAARRLRAARQSASSIHISRARESPRVVGGIALSSKEWTVSAAARSCAYSYLLQRRRYPQPPLSKRKINKRTTAPMKAFKIKATIPAPR
jgi:hypothetical protein